MKLVKTATLLNRTTLLSELALSTDYRIIDFVFGFDFSSPYRQIDMLVADLLAYAVCATFLGAPNS